MISLLLTLAGVATSEAGALVGSAFVTEVVGSAFVVEPGAVDEVSDCAVPSSFCLTALTSCEVKWTALQYLKAFQQKMKPCQLVQPLFVEVFHQE
ncbi:Uncharacterised protein [Streptococcus constellatus]|uniref:Uncharacterized protein n=1 Tax=Streptococcus constellatus TaxID=76860 RepID=A0A564TSH3_STRCV|nr:Uncharacterised protein [Streptococcus gordonii]VUX10207.1 Uncharacterised protein [Streptococcus constellatus]